jgi:hypothetical protein
MSPDLLARITPALAGNKHMLLLRQIRLSDSVLLGYKAAFVNTCCAKTVAVGEHEDLEQAIELAVSKFEVLSEDQIQ